MGLPTPVSYIIGALALVPFMRQIGLPPLQAHFFVFYFAFFPELLTFPHLTWAVVPAIFVVVAFQWTVSIASYGYLFRPLVGWERGVFVVTAFAGFMGMAYSDNPSCTMPASGHYRVAFSWGH